MVDIRRPRWLSWSVLVPLVALAILGLTWGRSLGWLPVVVVAVVLAGAVLAAVRDRITPSPR
jgi:Ca2+:H+ antiporter